jgi:hypothetical protein
MNDRECSSPSYLTLEHFFNALALGRILWAAPFRLGGVNMMNVPHYIAPAWLHV